nr:retrotransposon protein, putative, unclassified [Tanacetum cinerariifolium]
MSDNKDCLVEFPVVLEKKTVIPTITKVKVARPKQQEKLVRKKVRPHLSCGEPLCKPCLVFEDPNHPDKVYKVVKSLYGLHQALRAWYKTLAKYLLGNGFHIGEIDQTLFIKRQKGDILLVQCKKQTVVVTSTTEAEYVAASSCCRQVNALKALACGDWRPTKPNGASITLKRHNYIDILKNSIEDMLPLGEEQMVAELLQNDVAEKRNRILIEAARTMLADSKLPTTFWAKAVNTACYVKNRALVVKPHNKTPYELFRGRTRALSFMRRFGCHVTILNTLDHLGKFDGKADEGFFVGYSMNSKAFRVYNIRTRRVEENLHIKFYVNKPIVAGDGPEWLFDIDMLTTLMNYVPVVTGINFNDFKDGSPLFDSSPKISNDAGSPPIGDAGKKHDEVSDKESGALNALNYTFENLNIKYPDDPKMLGLKTTETYDGSEEEADFTNFESSIHINFLEGEKAIGTKWIFKNKIDERGIMIKNQARLVAQGYTQEEGIDYDEVFAPVARIEAIRLFLAYDLFMGFVVYQMDMKSDFIYERIKDECKKQTVVVTSITEAEYVAVASCCRQTNEASGSVREQPDEEENKLSQEDLQQIMMVVPVEEVSVEALQVMQSSMVRFGEMIQYNLTTGLERNGYFHAGRERISIVKRDYNFNYKVNAAEELQLLEQNSPILSLPLSLTTTEVGSSKRAAEVELNYDGSKRKKTNEASGQRMARVYEAAQSFTDEEWENIRARVEADEEITQRLQAEERNKYSKVNQAKMLVDLINQRKRYSASHKAEAKRNKPVAQAQQRTYMSRG